VLIGGTGTGKSHLAIAIARACIRGGARGRFYTVVDLVNRLESEARMAAQRSRVLILGECKSVVTLRRCHLFEPTGATRAVRSSLAPALDRVGPVRLY